MVMFHLAIQYEVASGYLLLFRLKICLKISLTVASSVGADFLISIVGYLKSELWSSYLQLKRSYFRNGNMKWTDLP